MKVPKRICVIIRVYYYLLYYVGIMPIEQRFVKSPDRKLIQFLNGLVNTNSITFLRHEITQ